MNAPVNFRADTRLDPGFRLGELKVEPQTGEVSGPGGREKLDPKVMAVLVYMARHAGQVVSRDDLIASLWPNSVVTDDALSRCFYELRRQLSIAGGTEDYRAVFETLPKRGYRMTAEVTALQAPPPRVAGRRSWRGWAGLAAAVMLAAAALVVRDRISVPPPGSRISIAVLPFVDMSAEHDQVYLADGISEEILNRLAQSQDLRVIARTSSFSFRDRLLDISTIADELGVAHVLEGSVRKSGDRVRITAQLIAAANGSHEWSGTYERSLSDVFAIQDEIAASVATELKAMFVATRPGGRRPATFEAYERFLQGEYLYNRRAPGDVERAVRYYEEALAIDPGFARAWATLAGAYAVLNWNHESPAKALLAKQGAAARRAVELAPDLAVAQMRLAQYYAETGDSRQAKVHWDRAVALDADDSLVIAFTAGDALDRGDLKSAISMQRRLIARDPLAALRRATRAVLLMADSQLDAALSEFRRTLEINPMAGPEVRIEIARILLLQERLNEAEAAIARIPEGKYRDYGEAMLYAVPGHRAAAEAALARLAANPDTLTDSVQLAEIYAFRGMNDQAFAVLQTKLDAYRRQADAAPLAVRYLQQEAGLSPFLKPLHADRRWSAFVVNDY